MAKKSKLSGFKRKDNTGRHKPFYSSPKKTTTRKTKKK